MTPVEGQGPSLLPGPQLQLSELLAAVWDVVAKWGRTGRRGASSVLFLGLGVDHTGRFVYLVKIH